MNVDYLLVGHFLGAIALGVYTLSFRVPELLIKDFCGNVGKVVFPMYTKLRDDPRLLSEGFLATMRYITMFTIPAALGLALCARPFVQTLFSEKWNAAIPVIPAIATYMLFRSLTFNAGDIYKAQGRIGLLNKLSFLQAAILLPVLLWSVTQYRSITAVAWAQAIVAFVGMIIRISVTSRVLKIRIRMILSAMEPAAVSASIMALAVSAILHATGSAPPWFQLVSSILIGGLVYFVSLWWFRPDVVVTAGNTLRMALARR